MKLPTEVRRLRDALQEDFRAKYQDVVTRLAFDLYVPLRPKRGILTDEQKDKIKSFAEKFSTVFAEVAGSMLGSADDISEIVKFQRWH